MRLVGLPGVEPGAKGDEALARTGCPMYALDGRGMMWVG